MGLYISEAYNPKFEIDEGRDDIAIQDDGIYGRGRFHRSFSAFPAGSFPNTKQFDLPKIPRGEWRDRIAEKEKNRSTLTHIHRHYGATVLNQQQTPLCWKFASTKTTMLRRVQMGLPMVTLSPGYGASLITGYRARGGYGGEALQEQRNAGDPEESFWPQTYTKNKQYLTQECIKNALLYRLTGEWLDVESDFDALATMLLLDIPCSIGVPAWSHQVCGTALVATPSGFSVEFVNSWGSDWNNGGFGTMTERYIRGFDAFGATAIP